MDARKPESGNSLTEKIIDCLISAVKESKKFLKKYHAEVELAPVTAHKRLGSYLPEEMAVIEFGEKIIHNLDRAIARYADYNDGGAALLKYTKGYRDGMIENILSDLSKGSKLSHDKLAELKVRSSIVKDIFNIVPK